MNLMAWQFFTVIYNYQLRTGLVPSKFRKRDFVVCRNSNFQIWILEFVSQFGFCVASPNLERLPPRVSHVAVCGRNVYPTACDVSNVFESQLRGSGFRGRMLARPPKCVRALRGRSSKFDFKKT